MPVTMLDDLPPIPFIAKLVEAAQKKQPLLLEGLWDAPKALIIDALVKATGKSVIVVSQGERENRLYDDLLFFRGGSSGLFELPAWEALPGEEIPPSFDIMGKRLHILQQLFKEPGPHIVLTSLSSLLQRLISEETLCRLFLHWKVGEEILFEESLQLLNELGYTRSKMVSDKGEFAVRGGIIDLFPIDAKEPYRIEFFDEQIDQIRTFDPISQRSTGKCSEVILTPAKEHELLKKESHTRTLFDYLPDAILIFDDLLEIEDKWIAIKELPGAKSPYLITMEEVLKAPLQKIYWSNLPLEALNEEVVSKGAETTFEICNQQLKATRLLHPFQRIADFFEGETLYQALQEVNPQPILIADNAKEEEALREGLPNATHFIRGYLSSGFVVESAGLILIPYTEFSHRFKVRREGWRTTYHTPLSEFHELHPGDLVVHFHNGIGKYLGIERQKNHLGVESEFLIVEYAENSKLYVPISQSHLVSRYIGTKEEKPQLYKLGTNKWAGVKAKTQQAILGYAKDLLEMQASREVAGGFAYPEDGENMTLFEEYFPYQETDDQLKAIEALKEDMRSPKAMDRLICGDVGYGKTEVAMRAAFKAVVDGGKQVAVLVPTTVLALQHYETFKARMAHFPVEIGIVSRFQTAKQIKETLAKVAAGEIDILVGTHRLISKDVSFKNLGMIIIDEEQRFGVRAKEALKRFKEGVDCLTLTATPIPRTLYISLINLRQMSTITSPPHDRLPIKTIIAERDIEMIKSAILRELARDGQVYFIHNRVETIHDVKEELQKLVPAARIGIAHGQMDSDLLDDVFHRFKSGQVDILLATSIVENGIDIPNANTILIDRADRFGISDLYQLRGRVGRWKKSSYAYFLVPFQRELPEVSQKRLQALVEASGFGGGIKLAMLDLELRGAGDLLGTQQSGHVSTIGFHLYCKLLKKTIMALQNKEPQSSLFETKMEFPFDARLPESYIDDASLRLELYHRLGDTSQPSEIDEIFTELADRFGKPPTPALWLYHMTRLRLFASKNQFISLKLFNHTLVAERQLPRAETLRKSFLLPALTTPDKLEPAIIARLTDTFKLP